MANNTIDTLSIQINSSSQGATVAINKLIDNLGRLNGALENYANDSNKYTRAMQNIATGLSGLNSAISKIDAKNLEAVSTSIKSLASAGKKLNDSFGSLGMDKATRDANALSKEMDKAVKSIMAFYNVDKGAGKQIAGDFADFMKGATWSNGEIQDMTSGGIAAWNNLGATLAAEAREYGADAGMEYTNSLVDYINHNSEPIHLPFSWKEIEADWKDAKRVLDSTLGVGGWTFSSPGNTDISSFAKQINQGLGTDIDTSSDVAAFDSLRAKMEEARSGMGGFSQSTERVQIDMDQLWSVLQRAASGVEQFKTTLSNTDGNPIQTMVTGLKGLEGLNIPDLSSVAELAANISKLGNKGASQGITNLPLLAQGLQSLSTAAIPDIPNLDGLNNLIATFNKLGGKKGNNASANIRPMIDGLRELSSLTGVTFPDSTNLLSLANAFSAFGRGTSASAIANIPQLATAFRNLMVTLSTAPTVSRNVIELANALANLASQGGKVGTASDSMTRAINRMSSILTGFYGRYRNTQGQIIQFGKNLLTSARHAGSAGRSYSNLASKVGLLYAKFWLLMRVFRVFNKAIGVASALTEVQNVVDTTFGNMSYKIEDFSKNAIKNFGMSELSAKQLASRFQAMGNAMGITGQQVAKAQQLINTKKTTDGMVAGYNKASNSMADMSINLTKLAADMASFYDIEQETVGKALQSGVMAGQTRPLRQYGIDLTNATLSEWAMNHGLNANIKSMTQAEKAMLRYQYVMAQTTNAQGDFTRTAKTWHNSVVVLKQQLQQLAAVIGSGLIQALKPFVNAMNNALSGLITFAKNVVNALGKIFGWEMEVNTSGLQMDEDAYDIDTSGLDDVADKAGKAGSATDKAADSAKKLKEQLQGFDKLNVIRSEDTSGSGGSGGGGGGGGGSGSGGGGGGTSGGDVSASLKKTKGMFESDIDNLFDLGRYISDSLATQLENIQWENIYSKARGFGTGLAQFLNGLITPRLFADLGRTVADCINTAFEFLNSFGTDFNWKNFGYSLGIGINAHLREYNWGTILNAAKVWGKGLASTINEAVSTTSFALVGKTLALQLRTAFTFLYNLGNDIEWGTVGKSLAEGINSFIENFPASQFANTIDAWVQGIGTMIGDAIKNIDKAKLIQKIQEFWSSLDPETLSLVIKTLALIKGASFALSIGKTLLDAICKEFIKQLAAKLVVSMAGSSLLSKAIGGGLGSAASSSGPMLGQAIGGGFLSSLAGIVGAIGGVVIAAKGLFDIWKKGWSASKGIMVAAGTGIFMAALGIVGVLTGPLALAIAGVTAAFTFLAANHKTIVEGMKKKASEFSQSWQKLKDDASKAGSDLQGTWTSMKTDFGELASDIGKKASDLGTKVTEKFEDLKTKASSKTSSLKTTVSNKFQEIASTASSKLEDLKTKASNGWTSMTTTASSKLKTFGSTVKEKFDNVRSTVEEKLSTAKSTVASAWDSMKSTAKTKLGESGVLGTIKSKFKDIHNAITDKLPVDIGNIIKFKKPSISLTTASKSVLGKTITYPTGFDVTWHRKGYANPLMFTRPTLVPSFNGFGDGNGGEMVYGHSNLMDDIGEASGASAMTAIGNQQLANDQRIIQLLSVIAEKEYGISSRQLFDTVRNEANYYRRRTGRGAFEY